MTPIVLQRWRVSAPPPLEELEPTRDSVYLSRRCVCERYGLLGVPTRVVDLAIDVRLVRDRARAESDVLVLERVSKPGKLDGARRDRWTWRLVDHRSEVAPRERAGDLPWVQVEIERAPGATTLELLDGSGAVVDRATYPSLRWVLDAEHDAGALIWWHAHRYFAFLPRDEVEALALSFSCANERTIAGANRAAQRELYRLARDLGWRRLTLRERVRAWGADGADRPIWHRAVDVPVGGSGSGPTGVGEATLRASSGGTLEPVGGAR
jgi:hypothetical protein